MTLELQKGYAGMNGKKRVTIKEVAQAAGVSTQTVSRVLNDRPDVAPETRKRVKEVIARLGYQPSYVARSLIQGRSCTLGVVGTGLEYFGPSQTLVGIVDQANSLGYRLSLSLMHHPASNNVDQLLQDMVSQHVDGIVWAVPEIGSNRDWIRQGLAQFPVPVMFLSMEPQPGLPSCSVDNRSGGYLATKHLLDQGYRQVGLITGPLGWWEARQRLLGWRGTLEEAGLEPEESLVVEGNWSAASGEQGLGQLLDQHPSVEAVFVSNDQMALGVIKATRRMNLRVPEDLAIVGFDDIPEAAYFCPPLTTVRQDMMELGCCAVRELDRLIEAGQEGGEAVEPRAIFLQPELVVRASSTPGTPSTPA
jgi:LacI family transcriptional regulator